MHADKVSRSRLRVKHTSRSSVVNHSAVSRWGVIALVVCAAIGPSDGLQTRCVLIINNMKFYVFFLVPITVWVMRKIGTKWKVKLSAHPMRIVRTKQNEKKKQIQQISFIQMHSETLIRCESSSDTHKSDKSNTERNVLVFDNNNNNNRNKNEYITKKSVWNKVNPNEPFSSIHQF